MLMLYVYVENTVEASWMKIGLFFLVHFGFGFFFLLLIVLCNQFQIRESNSDPESGESE